MNFSWSQNEGREKANIRHTWMLDFNALKKMFLAKFIQFIIFKVKITSFCFSSVSVPMMIGLNCLRTDFVIHLNQILHCFLLPPLTKSPNQSDFQSPFLFLSRFLLSFTAFPLRNLSDFFGSICRTWRPSCWFQNCRRRRSFQWYP